MACADGVSVHFADNAAQLDLDAVGKVLLTVSTLEACPAAHAIVTGHAETGERAAVARARAINVAAVLSKNGIDARRIRIVDANQVGSVAHQPDDRFVSISWK
jgi:outer membrane protein OmpA-like peptidoglycan-associated protein